MEIQGVNDQRSLKDQLKTLYQLANKNGLYDAADWLRDKIPELPVDPDLKPKVKLTEPQRRLLQSLKEETGDPGTWTEVDAAEAVSAQALARKGLIKFRGLEAQVIEDEPSTS